MISLVFFDPAAARGIYAMTWKNVATAIALARGLTAQYGGAVLVWMRRKAVRRCECSPSRLKIRCRPPWSSSIPIFFFRSDPHHMRFTAECNAVRHEYATVGSMMQTRPICAQLTFIRTTLPDRLPVVGSGPRLDRVQRSELPQSTPVIGLWEYSSVTASTSRDRSGSWFRVCVHPQNAPFNRGQAWDLCRAGTRMPAISPVSHVRVVLRMAVCRVAWNPFSAARAYLPQSCASC